MKHIHLSMCDLSQIILTQARSGKSREELTSFLKARGWPEISARHFIANVLAEATIATTPREHQDAAQDDQDQSRGNTRLIWVVALIGLVFVGLNVIGVLPLFR